MNAPDARALLETALTLHRQGRLQEALHSYQRVLQAVPNQPDALHYMGLIAHQSGNSATALRYLELAAKLASGNPEIWSNYGAVYLALKRPKDAEECFRRFLSLAPAHPGAHYALGTAILDQRRPKEAEAHLRKALELQPELAAAQGNLGLSLQQQGRLTEAESALREAITRDEALQPAWRTLAVTLEQQGRIDEALSAYRTALTLQPGDAGTHSALLLSLHFSATATKEELAHEARLFGERFAHTSPLAQATAPREGRKLRIGYLSADLHEHPVAYFLESVLAAHDKSAFEVFCYASQQLNDATTARLMNHAYAWRDITALTDAEAARLIAADTLDLLVDLGGHTGHNRLGVLAHRSAPKQASWLGYFDTTGLPQIDALIADRHVLPPEDDAFCTERVVRLPDYFLCFTPPQETAEVAPLPAETSGHITFGSFNRLAKLSDATFAMWTEILKAVPEAKLFLKANAFGDAVLVDKCVNRFAQHGILPERILCEGFSPLAELYRAYNRVDIALDPFPHHGGTTSFQALWSGVPVLTLTGDRYVSRMGTGILRTLGMEEWVVATPAEYVEKAVAFAGDLPRLATLRQNLRPRMLASPLMDAARFVQALEEKFNVILGPL